MSDTDRFLRVGDWVNDRIVGDYLDYDILVIFNDERLIDVAEYWAPVTTA